MHLVFTLAGAWELRLQDMLHQQKGAPMPPDLNLQERGSSCCLCRLNKARVAVFLLTHAGAWEPRLLVVFDICLSMGVPAASGLE